MPQNMQSALENRVAGALLWGCKMKIRIRHFACVLLSGLWLGVASLCPSSLYAQDSSPTLSLSARSSDNQHPFIAKSPVGERLFVVWDGMVDNHRRVFLRERVEGSWLPEIILDTEPEALNSSPVVDVDPAGNPHVAWLGKLNGKERVFYAFRMASIWSQWGAVQAGESAEDSCEAVTLKVDAEGKPWLAWQAGHGNIYSIFCAHLNHVTGSFDVQCLTPQAQNYNFFPEIFLTPEVSLLWYAAQNADFRLVGKEYDLSSGQWQEFALRDLERLPAKCLPYLLRKSPDTLAGLWYDEVDSADRVFLGLQGHESQGVGSVVDHMPEAINHFVSGTVLGDQLLITWCSETAQEGSQVYFTRGDSTSFEAEIRVSDGAKGYCAHPRVVGLPASAAVVWQSSLSDGGDGRILFREFQP